MRKVNLRHYADNRESHLVKVYKHRDEKAGLTCDLTAEWLTDHITSKPCIYCETISDPRGADRVDNSLGHLKANVVSCCQICNKARNNLFSFDEMKKLGVVIKEIRASRN